MRKLRALDLFCGAGGASYRSLSSGIRCDRRYRQQPKLRQTLPLRFHPRRRPHPPLDLMDFDFIWASPPCEGFSPASNASKKKGKEYIDLLSPTES